MTFRKGDKITIVWNGTRTPGMIALASANQVSLAVAWDIAATERMIAGYLGVMPLLREPDGVYRTLLGGEEIGVEPCAST